ncbi:uncharacterized protein LOC132747314 [Ruditapes philippinarum]|uniref:uncharacterized protein LOC132747314 n=1 Tax=Ruditapes philippinarum TaxID=129788 RepID=UPI00295AF42D|nr:uncharacterized protein LOC132747314 [Ruditapes philippinarum]
MNKTLAILAACAVFLGLVYLAEGQGDFSNFGGGGGYPYPGGGGYPGYPGGGGFPGHGGGHFPGGGGYCTCRRYCFRGERYSGRCRPPWRRRHWGGFRRRLVRCCPIYGPYQG